MAALEWRHGGRLTRFGDSGAPVWLPLGACGESRRGSRGREQR